MNSWIETGFMCFNLLQILPTPTDALNVPKCSALPTACQVSHPSPSFPSAASLEHLLSSQPNVISLYFGIIALYGTKRALSIFCLISQLSLCTFTLYPSGYKDIPSDIMPPVINLLWTLILVKYH